MKGGQHFRHAAELRTIPRDVLYVYIDRRTSHLAFPGGTIHALARISRFSGMWRKATRAYTVYS